MHIKTNLIQNTQNSVLYMPIEYIYIFLEEGRIVTVLNPLELGK